jgi:DNA-binding NarL/FixJ family response regulator
MLSEDPFFPDEVQDFKPEYTRYSDTGCELYPSCLECPLPWCAQEVPGGVNKIKLSRRNERIVAQAEKGKTARQIASRFGLSVRSVQRILHENRLNGGGYV